MEFWNKKDLVLVKKIEHYGKRATRKSIAVTAKAMGVIDKYAELYNMFQAYS